jgi:hypothetical protein
MRIRGSLFPLLLALAAAAPATAGAAVTVTAEEPFEETPQVADLGATTATVADDGTLTVRTRIVARPPAGWGNCVPQPSGLCVAPRMTVSWLLDWQRGGSPAEQGADAKVVATPLRDETAWQALRWDGALGRWSAATLTAAATDIGGAVWSLRPEQLAIPATATITMSIASRFHLVGDDGAAVDAADDAGPLAIPLGGFRADGASAPAPVAPAAPAPAARGSPLPVAAPPNGAAQRTPACVAASARLRRIERRVARLEGVVRGRGTAARRNAARDELRRLRPRRLAARSAKHRACTPASQPRGR